MDSLSSFRNRHAGATILVCGCGASLNELENPEKFLTIGVNDVGRKFQPDYLVVVNPRHQFKGDRFKHVENSQAKFIFSQLELGLNRLNAVRFRLGQYGGTDFSDPETLHFTRNSPYVAVCLAAQMGATRIGLIGVDFADHHFFAQTGRHALAGSLKQINEEYLKLAAALKVRGIELVNLGSTSRLDACPRSSVQALSPDDQKTGLTSVKPLKVVSYSTTPVAGVPVILARCISAKTEHQSCCVWAANSYANGVCFERDIQWSESPVQAFEAIDEADVVLVHNGKVDPSHAPLLQNKAVITMAHNYFWNVDDTYVRRGAPGLVVGQYQATLPDFAQWTLVPNPVPLWEEAFKPQPKPETVTICYTPSGKHERYAPGHRLYWHGKGYATTMRILDRLAARYPVRLEIIRDRQVSHASALAMKRRAHIVIDECVTGSYHRNSLEGLATGCVVVNGVGILPAVREAFHRCAPGHERTPFVFATLETLQAVLIRLIEQGPAVLAVTGSDNRQWMERHWDFSTQWKQFWQPAVEAARSVRKQLSPGAVRILGRHSEKKQGMKIKTSDEERVSVVIPHGGYERLPLLAATLASLQQSPAVAEVIVVEMGLSPLAAELAARWSSLHLFIEHAGAFERARALNAGTAMASHEVVIWHDNDLLHSRDFILRCARELRERELDFLLPYSAVHYLSEADSLSVIRGERSPQNYTPVNTLPGGKRGAWIGCVGAVRREFSFRHGGLLEGFRGWGGEDDAWFHKVSLLGRVAATARTDQPVFHLYHPLSGGYGGGQAASANPHYEENVARLRSIRTARTESELRKHCAPATATIGTVTAFTRGKTRSRPEEIPVWSYWEGTCPPWIRACRRTIGKYAPNFRLLNPATFELLREKDPDRSIDLSHLHVAHRADFIRAYLLQRHGGLWLDADCLVMQPLQTTLELLRDHDFLGHRARGGVISNAFIGARANSRIAAAYYARVRQTVAEKRRFSWNWLGGDLLTEVVAREPQGWHELPCERIQPICWSRPGDFLAVRDPEDHEATVASDALCYMLSNVELGKRFPGAVDRGELFGDRTFFMHLLRRALVVADPLPSITRESIAAAQAQLFREHKCDSSSGTGSNLEQTHEIRQCLPLLLESLGIRRVLDAPCGDLNWMRTVSLGAIEYIGVDILGEQISSHKELAANDHRHFVTCDLAEDPLPQADAIFCRDLLPHLSYAEIAQVLANFKRSGAAYLLTTTFVGPRSNHDTSGGKWRTVNLTLPPFSFPAPLHIMCEGCTEGGGTFKDKSIGVWKLADIDFKHRGVN